MKIPVEVAFSQHVRVGPVLVGRIASYGGVRVPWNLLIHPPENKDKFNVYVGLGAHATFPYPGISGFNDKNPLNSNSEMHKGDLISECKSPKIERIPRVGNLSLDHKYGWLLFPGKWGEKLDDNDRGDNPPRGPAFLDMTRNLLNPKDNTGRGLRWLDPWEWADGFPKVKIGSNNFSKADQIIHIGDNRNNELSSDEARSIQRGQGGNDTKKLKKGSGGTFIQDSGGEDDKLIFDGKIATYHGENLFDGTALLIDFNGDGKARFIDDVVVLDFFKKEGNSLVRGKGFIETINNLKASIDDGKFNLKQE